MLQTNQKNLVKSQNTHWGYSGNLTIHFKFDFIYFYYLLIKKLQLFFIIIFVVNCYLIKYELFVFQIDNYKFVLIYF